jgi:hypothetical protein
MVSIEHLITVSNLRARVKMAARNQAPEAHPYQGLKGSFGEAVWLEDFSPYTIDELNDMWREKFNANDGPSLCFLDIYFVSSRDDFGHFWLYFSRDRSVEIVIELFPGLPCEVSQARQFVEMTFVRVGTSATELGYGFDEASGSSGWQIWLSVDAQDVRVGELYSRWEALRRTLTMYHGNIGPDPRVQLVRDLWEKKFDAVLRLREGPWLECKETLRLNERDHKEQLANTICAFANANQSAIILVGYGTEKIDSVDTVAKLAPVPVGGNSCERYRNLIDAYVTPHVRGLVVEHADTGNGHVIVVITIPAQREADKWFKVRRPGSPSHDPEYRIWLRRGDGMVEVKEAGN